ncbi:cytochrome-c peroxidase [Lysobacter enzymogenes]|uniref:cytochrome-c peroxidase n=1 Tax=Lysobacter enzymogenes TaxID=69 RepID=UPI000897F90E|nr:cytochrome c peroxidase [Lysobacter enzymogenes]SDX42655.1 cytochrome c peroxidase [Lysobacter enzymogenes]
MRTTQRWANLAVAAASALTFATVFAGLLWASATAAQSAPQRELEPEPTPDPVSDPVAAPTDKPVAQAAASRVAASASAPVAVDLDECRRRLDAGGAQIDRDCLRRVYALPIGRWPQPLTDPGARWSELAPLPKQAPYPPDNPPSPAKTALGKRLFEDPRLSGSGQIACASCHDSELGWGDGRSVPFGHDRQRGRRNALPVAMSGFAAHLFWDGRASSLEAQVLHPLTDPREMAARPAAVLRRLRSQADYRRAYADAFGSPGIDLARTSQALASFQRSLVPRFNRFDRFLEGSRNALDDRQLWGLHLFRTRARCMNCHSGATLSDDGFHNLGLHFYGRALQDLGRYEVTGDRADAGKFKTPSLRNVAKTGPWMHNGRFATLRGVVNLYNAGMPRPQPTPQQIGDPLFPQPDPLLHPLDLHRTELEAITAFLETL